jgi:hypothetical protein
MPPDIPPGTVVTLTQTSRGSGKKGDRMRWLVKLNKARHITHHTEKGPLPRDQIEFVPLVHTLVKEHIELRHKLDPKKSYLSD